MSIGKGINLSTGFDLNAQQPLDNRDVFETIRERDALPQINPFSYRHTLSLSLKFELDFKFIL